VEWCSCCCKMNKILWLERLLIFAAGVFCATFVISFVDVHSHGPTNTVGFHVRATKQVSHTTQGTARASKPIPALVAALAKNGTWRCYEDGKGEPLPLVSVLMLTRDRVILPKLSLRWLLNQTYPNLELVVVDDSETGNWPNSLRQVVGRSRRIPVTYIHQPARIPLSIGVKRNLGVKVARGMVVINWDDDDIHLEDRIEYQVASLIRCEAHITIPEASVFMTMLGKKSICSSAYGMWRMFRGQTSFLRHVWRDWDCHYPNTSSDEDSHLLACAWQNGLQIQSVLNRAITVRHGENTWKGDSLPNGDGLLRIPCPNMPEIRKTMSAIQRERAYTAAHPTVKLKPDKWVMAYGVPAPLAPRWMEMPLPKDHGGQRVYWPRLAKPNKMKVGYLSQLQHGKGGEMDWNEIGRLEGKEGLLGAYHGMSFTSSYC